MAGDNYNFRATETQWQKYWDEHRSFEADVDTSKPKYYVLEMFPYPSGNIHMGHLRNYTIGDVVARFKRAQGYNVLHPMGWDGFGLPAENAAIEKKVLPGDWTFKNIDHMRGQLQSIGLSYDWKRELATCSSDYYKYEQKIFLDFLKEGLVYRDVALVNWDPVDQTVLANEQVIDGRGWRSGAIVEKKELAQWFLRISDFSDDLLEGLETLDGWPEHVRRMQEQWIGKSYGQQVFFDILDSDETLEVFTTRPETLFGASFCAISPHHPLSLALAEKNETLAAFIEKCNQMGTAAEIIEKAEKEGVDTGLRVQHPLQESVTLPIYVANFVLMDYGTGAVFACPAHDARDHAFAKKYDLPITQVIQPSKEEEGFDIQLEAYTGDGTVINSDFLTGLSIADAKKAVADKLTAIGNGKISVQYRLRDWGVSRQRYWGCPIPIIHCEDCGAVPVPEDQLPVKLPEEGISFETPGNPLDRHPEWKHVACPRCSKPAVRETDTFDTFFESSWYFARFCSPNSAEPLDKEQCNYWLSVDQYIGGIEHAVLHLLYARFFTRALYQCGYLSVKEPFSRLLTQGMVCQETYKDSDGKWLFPEEVVKQSDGAHIHHETGKPVEVGRVEKMSKSKKNVVDPAHIIEHYGADTARLFMLSDSPPERDLLWSESGVDGAWRYVNRLWRLTQQIIEQISPYQCTELSDVEGELLAIRRQTHKTIKSVTEDLEKFHFNKSVARIRELTNALGKQSIKDEASASVAKEALEVVVRLFEPLVPHLTSELWKQLGYEESLVCAPWPEYDESLIVEEMVKMALQLNGKVKTTIEIAVSDDNEKIEQEALSHPTLQKALEGKTVRKVIIVPNRVINVVAA